MFRFNLLLTPVARVNTIVRSNGGLSERHYSSWYLFGFRVVHLHLNQSRV